MINGESVSGGMVATALMWKLLITIKKEVNKVAKIRNIHPGEVLVEDFLKPLNITAYTLAKDIQVDQTRISEIIKGKRRITPDTALRLSIYFNTSPQLWLGLQNDYDLEEEILSKQREFSSIKPYQKLPATKKYSIKKTPARI
jgi:addiction module HigA family antidote